MRIVTEQTRFQLKLAQVVLWLGVVIGAAQIWSCLAALLEHRGVALPDFLGAGDPSVTASLQQGVLALPDIAEPEVTEPVTATAAWSGFDALRTSDVLLMVAPRFVAGACTVAGALLLLRIVRSPEVFTHANAVRLGWLGLVIALGGLLSPSLSAVGSRIILDGTALAPYTRTIASMSLVPLLVAALVLGLAYLWEHGVKLARDSDGLV